MKLRPVLEGAGVATLYVLPFANGFLTPSLATAYHHPYPVTTIARAILLMALLIWLTAALSFHFVEQLPERVRNWLWIAPVALLAWFLCQFGVLLLKWPHVMYVAHLLGPSSPIVLAVVAGALLLTHPDSFRRVTRGIGLVYAVVGFGLLTLLPQLLALSVHREPAERTKFERPGLPTVPAGQPRILWILMDEMSYDQAFEHPEPGLPLPHLRSFAGSSVLYSDLQPLGNVTERVVPALMMGKPVVALRTPYEHSPEFRSTPDGPWQRFDQYNTVFADARALGWSTGVAGWYNPYCRLLADVLDRCSWQYSEGYASDFPRRLSSTNSTAMNMLALVPFRLRLAFLPGNGDDMVQHAKDLQGVMEESIQAVRDPGIRFLFLHLPVPHPPGIYDRRLHSFAEHGNYLDNLVLADDCLGQITDALAASGHAQDTTVILSSDHSWRIAMWQDPSYWTPEEQRVTEGRFDPRPVLAVHLAGRDEARTITQPQNALILHRILEGLLRGELHTAADLAALPLR